MTEQIPLFDDLPVYCGRVKRHALYGVWSNMKTRCYNPKATGFKHYGGRGIVVCNEWRNSSRAFVTWAIKAGWQPGLQLDRENNDGPYSPGNCRFVTNRENSCNRRDTHRLPDGTPVVYVPRPAGVSAGAIRCRIRAGMAPKDAVAKPVHGYFLSDGTPLLEAARAAGLKPPTVFARLQRGLSPDEAIGRPLGSVGTRRFLSDGTPLRVACRSSGITLQAALYRIKRGWSPDDAVSVPRGGKRPSPFLKGGDA